MKKKPTPAEANRPRETYLTEDDIARGTVFYPDIKHMMKKSTPSRKKTAKKQRIKLAQENRDKKLNQPLTGKRNPQAPAAL